MSRGSEIKICNGLTVCTQVEMFHVWSLLSAALFNSVLSIIFIPDVNIKANSIMQPGFMTRPALLWPRAEMEFLRFVQFWDILGG